MAFTSNTQKQTSHSQVHWELLQHTYYSYSDYKKYIVIQITKFFGHGDMVKL